MTVDERIELLKSNILHYTRDLLQLQRRRDPPARPEDGPIGAAAGSRDGCRRPPHRELYAQPQNNGVTGFVAATGKSYLCEDTTEDPLYLGRHGAQEFADRTTDAARRGDRHVQCRESRAAGLQRERPAVPGVFCRDVAAALNTLELLVAEKASTAAESVEAIHSAVALPVDDILNDAVNIMERYIGHEPEVAERLAAHPAERPRHQAGDSEGRSEDDADARRYRRFLQHEERPMLRGQAVLVADADESVRSAAHALLERYGCIVETAHDGGEAVFMVRSTLAHGEYDAVIADIRLPDMSGYDLMLKLQEIVAPVPLILMTGFGYDPGHSIVKARQAGLSQKAVLYKPFRLDQLLETVEEVIKAPGRVTQPQAQT